MEYGVIYIKVCPKKGTPGDWIKYCYILSSTPKSFQQNVKEIANNINSKYSNDIIIPMDIDVHPGCTTTVEKVEEIATDMYNQFCELADRQGIPNSIRCAYSVGEMKTNPNSPQYKNPADFKSTHHLPPYPAMIKLGRGLDESDEPGIFKL